MKNQLPKKHNGLKSLSMIDASEVNSELDALELHYHQSASKQAKDEIAVFNEAINLFFELLTLNENVSFNVTKESLKDARVAHSILMVDTFNCLRASYKLLLSGYYEAIPPLLRRVHECTVMMLFFQTFPSEANSFLRENAEWHRKYPTQGYLRQKLEEAKKEGFPDLVQILKEEYSKLSILTHARLESMLSHIYPNPREKSTAFTIGGHLNPLWLHSYFQHLILYTILGLRVASLQFDTELRRQNPIWISREETLEETDPHEQGGGPG